MTCHCRRRSFTPGHLLALLLGAAVVAGVIMTIARLVQ